MVHANEGGYMIRIWLLLLGLVTLYVRPVQAQALPELLLDCGFAATAPEGMRVGAMLVNLTNGAGCMENPDTVFHTASVSKIFIAAAYFEAEAQGRFQPDNGMQFTREYWMGGRSDCLAEEQIGIRYTYRELVYLMITCSDNAATWMVMDALGWDQVDAYVARLGIEGIGQVIPYSEVDRLKLTVLDERWADVPAAIASRFYRQGMTADLSAYFDRIPARPQRDEFTRSNAAYFESYTFNTLTPRALAQFFVKLRDDRIGADPDAAFVAEQVFQVLLGTQRQYSTQALPGMILVGSKNGFDRGLLAEAALLFSTMPPRVPTGIAILFTQYVPLTDQNSEFPTSENSTLRRWMLEQTGLIASRLYPGAQNPRPQTNTLLTSAAINDATQIDSCWLAYRQSGFDSGQVFPLEQCLQRLPPRITYPVDTNITMGLVMRGVSGADTYVTIVFTAPDNRRYSYQIVRQSASSYALYWFHPVELAGQWQVDVFVNLLLASSMSFIVQR
jgi:hypothetical protein